jgi:hypothetical protein
MHNEVIPAPGPDVHSMDDNPLATYPVPGVLIPYSQQPNYRSLDCGRVFTTREYEFLLVVLSMM